MNLRTTCTTDEINRVHQMLPGAQFVGMFSDLRLNGGRELPLIQGSTEAEFAAAVRRGNRKAFIRKFNREPITEDELTAWING